MFDAVCAAFPSFFEGIESAANDYEQRALVLRE